MLAATEPVLCNNNIGSSLPIIALLPALLPIVLVGQSPLPPPIKTLPAKVAACEPVKLNAVVPL